VSFTILWETLINAIHFPFEDFFFFWERSSLPVPCMRSCKTFRSHHCTCPVTTISTTFWSGQFREKWNGLVPVDLAPGGAPRCATVPTQQDRLVSVRWVSTFPLENIQYIALAVGACLDGSGDGQTTGNGNGKERVMVLVHAVLQLLSWWNAITELYSAMLLVWRNHTREWGLFFSIFFCPIRRCIRLDLRLGHIFANLFCRLLSGPHLHRAN